MLIGIISIVVAVVGLFIYYIWLDNINIIKSPNEIEPRLPGRPARRTIGRKNADIVRSIIRIFFGYVVLCIGFYAVPEFSLYLGNLSMLIVIVVAVMAAVFILTPANRIMHAYTTFGHVAVVHLIMGYVGYSIISLVLFDNEITIEFVTYAIMIIIGAMLIFSRKVEVVV